MKNNMRAYRTFILKNDSRSNNINKICNSWYELKKTFSLFLVSSLAIGLFSCSPTKNLDKYVGGYVKIQNKATGKYLANINNLILTSDSTAGEAALNFLVVPAGKKQYTLINHGTALKIGAKGLEYGTYNASDTFHLKMLTSPGSEKSEYFGMTSTVLPDYVYLSEIEGKLKLDTMGVVKLITTNKSIDTIVKKLKGSDVQISDNALWRITSSISIPDRVDKIGEKMPNNLLKYSNQNLPWSYCSPRKENMLAAASSMTMSFDGDQGLKYLRGLDWNKDILPIIDTLSEYKLVDLDRLRRPEQIGEFLKEGTDLNSNQYRMYNWFEVLFDSINDNNRQFKEEWLDESVDLEPYRTITLDHIAKEHADDQNITKWGEDWANFGLKITNAFAHRQTVINKFHDIENNYTIINARAIEDLKILERNMSYLPEDPINTNLPYLIGWGLSNSITNAVSLYSGPAGLSAGLVLSIVYIATEFQESSIIKNETSAEKYIKSINQLESIYSDRPKYYKKAFDVLTLFALSDYKMLKDYSSISVSPYENSLLIDQAITANQKQIFKTLLPIKGALISMIPQKPETGTKINPYEEIYKRKLLCTEGGYVGINVEGHWLLKVKVKDTYTPLIDAGNMGITGLRKICTPQEIASWFPSDYDSINKNLVGNYDIKFLSTGNKELKLFEDLHVCDLNEQAKIFSKITPEWFRTKTDLMDFEVRVESIKVTDNGGDPMHGSKHDLEIIGKITAEFDKGLSDDKIIHFTSKDGYSTALLNVLEDDEDYWIEKDTTHEIIASNLGYRVTVNRAVGNDPDKNLAKFTVSFDLKESDASGNPDDTFEIQEIKNPIIVNLAQITSENGYIKKVVKFAAGNQKIEVAIGFKTVY